MSKIKVAECDVVYLSYDEPNAEQNYADLLTKIPWAKRIHGVDGSDSAHKACARIAETERVVIIDGDNIVRPELIQQEVEFYNDSDMNCVISWGARNVINGLIYGNGGVKCWPTELILNMRTHENAESDNAKTQVDFCWDINYVQMDKCMSDVYNNGSAQQAWRAGFREGVKMSLLEGSKPTKDKLFNKQVHWKNLHRLLIWMHVGMDIQNGDWAIYGARQGCYMTNCTDWDYLNVRDFKWLNTFWEEKESKISTDMLKYEIMGIGETLEHELGISIDVPFNNNQSILFKTLYTNPPRMKNNTVIS
jgi:hypothetical protein